MREKVNIFASISGTSALNGLRFLCSNLVEISSSEGTSGIYGQFESCPMGFTHARIASTVFVIKVFFKKSLCKIILKRLMEVLQMCNLIAWDLLDLLNHQIGSR